MNEPTKAELIEMLGGSQGIDSELRRRIADLMRRVAELEAELDAAKKLLTCRRGTVERKRGEQMRIINSRL